MNSVNLKNFVDINIQPHETSKPAVTRDTIALYTYESLTETAQVREFDSLLDVPYAETSDTYKYLKMYFDNGGIKARVIEDVSYSALDAATVKSLPNEIICVSCVSDNAHINDCYEALKAIAEALNADPTVYGINEKFIIARSTAIPYTVVEDETSTEYPADPALVKNFAVKYSTIIGAEMTIAAYVSQVDIDAVNSVFDYAFTEENIAEESITDATYKILQQYNYNVDITLANAVRNCGGNCKDGYDLINAYVKIVLHQTLTDKLVALLAQKIKSVDGISKIYSTIAQELERYKSCGYLTTDKIWQDNDLIINYNHVNYTIISKGDALLNGYLIKVLPMSSLTDADKAAHSTPPIYVIIADQYGIRKITITGEVI